MRQSVAAAVWLLTLATGPSMAEPATPREGKPASSADETRDRRDGMMKPPPPLCDDASVCDRTRLFRFRGRMTF